MKALTGMGYKATDSAKEAIIDGLDSVEEMTGGSVVKLAREAGKSVAYQMNTHHRPADPQADQAQLGRPTGGRMRVRNMVVLAVVVAGAGLGAAPAAPAGADVVTRPARAGVRGTGPRAASASGPATSRPTT